MAYIPDLKLYTYGQVSYGPTFAIGWLDGSEPYTRGKAPLALLIKMKEWAMNPKETAINWTRGLHFSNLKTVEKLLNASYPTDVFSPEVGDALNNGEFHVHHDGRFYASPVMIYHYILDYDYLPPQEYIDAVLHGELITNDNLEKFEVVIGEEFSDEVVHDMFLQVNEAVESGKNQEALQIIEKLFTILPNDTTLFAFRGTAFYNLGEFENAQADLDMVLHYFKREGGQNLAHILAYLGKIAQAEGDLKQAKIYLQRAWVAYPEDSEIKGLLEDLS